MTTSTQTRIRLLFLTGVATVALLGGSAIAQSPGASPEHGAAAGAGGDDSGPPGGAIQNGQGADPNAPSGIVAPPQMNFPGRGTSPETGGGDASGSSSPTEARPIPPGWKLPGPPPVGGMPDADAGQGAATENGAAPGAATAPGPTTAPGAARETGATSPTAPREAPPGWKLPGPPPVGAPAPGATSRTESPAGQPTLTNTGRSHGASSTWPCIQARVPELSVGAIWGGGQLDVQDRTWSSDPDLVPLVDKLSQRRVSEEEAKSTIRDYVDGLKDGKADKLSKLFIGLFQIVDAERKQIITGIERYAERQKSLADKIRQDSRELSKVETKMNPTSEDQETIEGLRTQFEWDQKIYDSREQSLSAVCETPVLIEQRLYLLARAIQEHMG